MQRTNIYLTPEESEALDRIAKYEGTTRSSIIRRLIDRSLGDGANLEVDLAAIELSFGVLGTADITIASRDDDERSNYLQRIWRQ
jgi:predicted DNA-binding protein